MKILKLLFKTLITLITVCLGVVTIPLSYIACMLIVIGGSIGGCSFRELFEHLNMCIKQEIINIMYKVKYFWSL